MVVFHHRLVNINLVAPVHCPSDIHYILAIVCFFDGFISLHDLELEEPQCLRHAEESSVGQVCSNNHNNNHNNV